jgi:hypothetical protein
MTNLAKITEDDLINYILNELRMRSSHYKFSKDYAWVGLPITNDNKIWVIKCTMESYDYKIPNKLLAHMINLDIAKQMKFVDEVVYEIMAKVGITDRFTNKNIIDVPISKDENIHFDLLNDEEFQ